MHYFFVGKVVKSTFYLCVFNVICDIFLVVQVCFFVFVFSVICVVFLIGLLHFVFVFCLLDMGL